MRALPLLGLALALAACGGSPPMAPAPPADGPYAGIPSRPGEGPIATAQPVAPTGDPARDAFLAELAAAIDRHDWLAVARAMDPAVFPEQRAFLSENGSGDRAAPQLLVETLGLRGLHERGLSWATLDRIAVVTFREYGVESPLRQGTVARAVVSGDVRLDDGTTLPLQFTLTSRGGVFVVEVPVG